MKKFNSFETQLGESVVLTDKAKLSLYKKSQNSGYSIDVLEEVYRRGYHCWTEEFGGNPDSFAFDRVNSFIAGGFASQLDEDLRQWFNPSHPKGGWKRINSKGEAIGPCAREPGEPKPKCMSNEKRAQLSKKERAAAVAAKRRHDPVADRSGKGGKPVNVSNVGKGKISEVYIEEKNAPTNPSLWSKAKSLARSKFDVYPSAYANGWAAKWYKSKGGGWKSVSEESELEEKCWTGYKQVGMKKKGDRMVPNCVPTKEDAEEHSKDFTKPSSRFIGSDELTDIYKQQTPGQIIKKIVREHLEEAAMAMPPQVTPPAVVGQVKPGVRVAPKPTETSGRAAGRMSSQTGSMSARPNVKVSSGVQPSIERTWKTPGRGTMGTSGGSMSATPKVSTAYSQGGVNVGKAMGASKQTSPVVKGMTSAGREAATTITKAAPTVAKGLGTAARIAGGPAATAAMAVMSPTPAGAGEDEKKRQETLKSYNPYKSSGRSVADYEKQTLTPQKYEAPKAAPAPKVDAPTPPSRPEYMSRGQAFQAARSEVGGAGGKFSYGGKEYQTNVAGEKYVAKPTTTSVKDESESGGKTLKKIKEAISEAIHKGKKVPLERVASDRIEEGDVIKTKFATKNLQKRGIEGPHPIEGGDIYRLWATSKVAPDDAQIAYHGHDARIIHKGKHTDIKHGSVSAGYAGDLKASVIRKKAPKKKGNVVPIKEDEIDEATYKGKKVPLNKPMKGDVKKSKVFVDPDGDGKAQKVNFGDKNLSIKKHIPARKKSYCARSSGQGNLTDKTSANYWSRRAWNCEETEIDEARNFSYLYKKPRKGTVAYYAMMQRKKEEREIPPIEPKDQMVGTAKIYKDKKEVNELSVPAGTTGKREKVSTPMVAVRMASGKIEKHPPGKSGSSGGGDE